MFKRISDEEKLDKAFKKALKADPVAANAAMTATKLVADGKKIANDASNQALEDMLAMLPTMFKGKQQKIDTLLKFGKRLGAMQAFTEVLMPDIYNDMYDKLSGFGLKDMEVEMVANIYLAMVVKNLAEGLEEV